ncbi:MAG: BTAD domain-containing putative transcriptional regulator [Actinoplanes sp.]
MNGEGVRPTTVQLLRGFCLVVDRERVAISWSAQRLTAFLALHDRPLTRSYVAGTLWPDTTDLKASANLRSSLWRVQRICRHVIDASGQQVWLASHVAVDFRAAQRRAHQLLDPAPLAGDALAAGVRSELAGDLLPDWYDDDWVIVERERHHQLRLYALESLCERLTSAGRHGEAVEAGLAAVSAEPLRESANRVLMEAHLAVGNRCEAIRQYDRFCRQLLDELGVEPSPTLQRLLPSKVSVA